jgi:hypothetical protein
MHLSNRLGSDLTSLPSPWRQIRNDLHVPPRYCHGITLHLLQHTPNYRVEHTLFPAANSTEIEREGKELSPELVVTEINESHSPLQFPRQCLQSLKGRQWPLRSHVDEANDRCRGDQLWVTIELTHLLWYQLAQSNFEISYILILYFSPSRQGRS